MEQQAAAGGLAEADDAGRVAAEGADVLPYPLERAERVPHAAVRDTTGCSHVEEAERAEAGIDGDDDDRLLAGQQRAVVHRL